MWKALRRGSYGNAELPNLSLHSYILRSAVKQGPALQCSSTHRGLRLVVPIHSNLVPHVAFQCLADLLQFLAFLSFFPCGFQKRAWPAPVSTLMAKAKKTIWSFPVIFINCPKHFLFTAEKTCGRSTADVSSPSTIVNQEVARMDRPKFTLSEWLKEPLLYKVSCFQFPFLRNPIALSIILYVLTEPEGFVFNQFWSLS